MITRKNLFKSKIPVMVLAALLACLAMPWPAAASGPNISIAPISASPGATVNLTINVDAPGGIAGYVFVIQYDPSVLTPDQDPDSANPGTADPRFGYPTYNPNYAANEIAIAGAGSSAITTAGSLAIVPFTVNSNATAVQTSLSFASTFVNSITSNITNTCTFVNGAWTIPTTLTPSFSTDNKTVTVTASGLNAGATYYLNYYDGNNSLVVTEAYSGVTSLASQLTLGSYQSSAPGTWTADLLEGGSSGPVVGTATFTVTPQEIPEFPTPLALLAVVGACAGLYLWMRKRRGKVMA